MEELKNERECGRLGDERRRAQHKAHETQKIKANEKQKVYTDPCCENAKLKLNNENSSDMKKIV